MKAEKKRRGFIAHIVIVLLAAVISGAVWIITTHTGSETLPSKYYDDYSIPDDAVSIWGDIKIRAVNSRISNGNIVHMRKFDPQLHISFGEDTPRKFRSLIVKLQRDYPYNVGSVVFYPNEKGRYDDECTDDFLLPAGEKVLYFNIPLDSYEKLRLDIDATYWIDDILISQQEIEPAFTPNEHYNIASAIIYFLVLVAFFEVLLFFRKDFAALLGQLWHNKFRVLLWLVAAAAVVAAALTGTYYAFKRLDIYFSWFWVVMISLPEPDWGSSSVSRSRLGPGIMSGKTISSIKLAIKVLFPVRTGPTTPMYKSPWVLSAISR